MAKCNLNEEEREAALRGRICEWSKDELEQLRDIFPHYLLISSPEGRSYRELRCTRCKCWNGYYRDELPELWRLRHNDRAICPECKGRATVKMAGRINTGASMYATEAVNKLDVDEQGSIYLSSGIAFADWDTEQQDYDITFAAKRAYYFAPGKCQSWKRTIYDKFFSLYMHHCSEWEPMRTITEPFAENPLYGFDGYAYVIGAERLSGSCLRYVPIAEYYEKHHNVSIYTEPVRLLPQLMAEACMRPQLEMCIKLGMHEIVCELIRDGRTNARDINWRASNPAAFTRLSKRDFAEFRHDPSLTLLKSYHTAYSAGLTRTMAEYLEITDRIGIPRETTVEFCKRYGVPLRRLAEKYKTRENIQLWTDYISAAEKLQYDLSGSLLMPSDIRERHDNAVENVKHMANQDKDRLYQKRRKALIRKYSFTAYGLTVIVPEGIEDIIREGKTLRHCVGGYAHRHVEGKTTILFIRRERKPDTPYLTVELDDEGNIRQIHGYRNEAYNNAIKPQIRYKDFIEAWQTHYKSDKKRKKESAA